jgi:sporulation protein YlmC with PRC-barrel domain/CBS domain-containing protein
MRSNQIREHIRKASLGGNNNTKYFMLSEIVNKKVQTKSGVTIGKLKDLVFKEDPRYAEVTGVIVERSLGRPPLNVPWSNVIELSTAKTIVQDPPEGKYPEIKHGEEQLLLRDKILDKRILDTEGFDVEVVYDIQLLLVKDKLFVVAADVDRHAMLRRLGFRRLAKSMHEISSDKDIIPWRYVQALPTDLTGTKGDVKLTITREGLKDIHPEDLADILEELSHEERIHIFGALDSEVAADALEATEPRVQREILASTSTERVAQIFAHLSPVQIADIIGILPHDDSQEFVKILKGDVASKVHQLLSQHDVSASTLAMHCYLGFPGDLTVEEAFTRYREEARRCDVTMYIYVVDSDQHLRGVIDINELLQADPKNTLEQIMTRNVVGVAPTTMRGEVEALFLKYHFRAVPIVDESKKIMGVIREKDVFLKEE